MRIFSAIIAVVVMTLCFCLDLLCKECSKDKKFLIRILSCCGGIALMALDAIVNPSHAQHDLLLDVAVADMILLLHPSSFEKPGLNLRFSIGLLTVAILETIFISVRNSVGSMALKHERFIIILSSLCLVGFAFEVILTKRRYPGTRQMLMNSSFWHGMEDSSNKMFSMAFLMSMLFAVLSVYVSGNVGRFYSAISFIMLMLLYPLLYFRAMYGRTGIMLPSKEDKVREMIEGDLRSKYPEGADSDRKMSSLYDRVRNAMEIKKLYLDPNLQLDDLVEKVYTNKLYLSRTINAFSGMNFRQFVNHYRVDHAKDLLRKDPHLKMNEVSEKSGFNNTASFNMAFKTHAGTTPTEWVQDEVLTLK